MIFVVLAVLITGDVTALVTQTEGDTKKFEELVYFRIPKSGSNAFLRPLGRAQSKQQGLRRITVIDHGDGCRDINKCNASTYSQETFAILREPCDRFRSQYYHQRKKVPSLLEDWTPENFLAFMESTCSNIDEANRRADIIKEGQKKQRLLDKKRRRAEISEDEWEKEVANLEKAIQAQISAPFEPEETGEIVGQKRDCDNHITGHHESISDFGCPAGVPYPAMNEHRVIVWPQALWIDAQRTHVICYDSDQLEQRVKAFVFRHTGLHLDPFTRPNTRQSKQNGPEDDFNMTDSMCQRVLNLYPDDTTLWERNCA